jgi:hypothetical protein
MIAYSAHGPKEIGVSGFIRNDQLSIGRDHCYFKYLVCSQAVVTTNWGMAASSDISANTDIWIHASHNDAAMLSSFGINVSHLLTGSNSQCIKVLGLRILGLKIFTIFKAANVMCPDRQ